MRSIARSFLVLVVLLLAAGPTLTAAPLVRQPAVAAPGYHPAGLASIVVTVLGGGAAVFGAIRIKDTGSLAKKFVQRAGAASGDYKDGVAQAGGDWEQNAKASEGNYEQGVTQAIGDKRFGKGISNAGAGKYVNRATTLGATRYGPGVQASEGEWAKGTQPYLDRLKSLDLPPKGPRRSPQNQARANAVAVALGAMKVGK